MPDPKVIEYIKSEIQKGTIQSKIKSDLLSNGWSAEDITLAFNSVTETKSEGFTGPLKIENIQQSKPLDKNKKTLMKVSIFFILVLIFLGTLIFLTKDIIDFNILVKDIKTKIESGSMFNWLKINEDELKGDSVSELKENPYDFKSWYPSATTFIADVPKLGRGLSGVRLASFSKNGGVNYIAAQPDDSSALSSYLNSIFIDGKKVYENIPDGDISTFGSDFFGFDYKMVAIVPDQNKKRLMIDWEIQPVLFDEIVYLIEQSSEPIVSFKDSWVYGVVNEGITSLISNKGTELIGENISGIQGPVFDEKGNYSYTFLKMASQYDVESTTLVYNNKKINHYLISKPKIVDGKLIYAYVEDANNPGKISLVVDEKKIAEYKVEETLKDYSDQSYSDNFRNTYFKAVEIIYYAFDVVDNRIYFADKIYDFEGNIIASEGISYNEIMDKKSKESLYQLIGSKDNEKIILDGIEYDLLKTLNQTYYLKYDGKNDYQFLPIALSKGGKKAYVKQEKIQEEGYSTINDKVQGDEKVPDNIVSVYLMKYIGEKLLIVGLIKEGDKNKEYVVFNGEKYGPYENLGIDSDKIKYFSIIWPVYTSKDKIGFMRDSGGKLWWEVIDINK